MTFDIDTSDNHSATAAICENAQLYGATPEPGEHDPRDIWDRDDAIAAVSEAFRILAQGGVSPDGFQLADERESLLLLAATGERPIVEVSTRDPWWGARPVAHRYEGNNVLGRLWMELRQQLR